MALNFDFRKTTLSVLSEISSAFQNTFCFFQKPFYGRETQFSVTCKFWVHWGFFWKSKFFMSCLTSLPKWSCRTFFSGLEKNQTFSHFFMCWGGKNQSDFFHEAKQIPTGPPLKNDDEPKFSLFVNPPIFSLENQFYKISHYTVNKYQGSSNFWTVWPILKIQNAK